MILWLLRRQLIVQEHTYIYLMESPSLQMTLQVNNDTFEITTVIVIVLQSDGCSMLTLTPLLAKAIHTLDTELVIDWFQYLIGIWNGFIMHYIFSMQTAIVYEAGELSKRLPLKADFEREQDNLAKIIPVNQSKINRILKSNYSTPTVNCTWKK